MRRRILHFLEQTGARLQVAGAPHGRYKAFQEAAHFLEHLDGDIEELANSGRLFRLLPLRAEVRRAIEEILAGREPEIYEKGRESLDELSSLQSVPLRYLEKIHRNLGIRAIKDLEDALASGELQSLDWLPPPIVKRIEVALLPAGEKKRWTLGETLPIARKIFGGLRGMLEKEFFSFTGRLRRKEEWVDGIYLIAAPQWEQELHRAFKDLPGCFEVEQKTSQVSQGRSDGGIFVELRSCPRKVFPFLLNYHSGAPSHTKKLRRLAKRRSFSLRQDRLKRGSERLALESERELYEVMGLDFIEPELRRGTNELDLALEGRLPKIPKPCHVKGDLHVHSNFSDGVSTVEQLSREAKERGQQYLALCDHSKSLRCARGLSEEGLLKKIALIDELNENEQGLSILCGAEVDILPDGSLDYREELLQRLDLVIAAVHQDLTCSPKKLTQRMLAALENPRVHVLAHATTRILGMRPAKSFDVEEVLSRCKERKVALEVNGHAHRMDPPLPIIERALEKGILLSLGSDAHHFSQMWMLELALSQARRAGASHESILNTWPKEDLIQWLKQKK